MPILINCPSCHQVVRVPDSLIHQYVRCPTCENTFTATPEMAIQEPLRAEPGAAPPTGGEFSPHPEPPRPAPAPAGSGRMPFPMQPHRGVAILILGILSIVFLCPGLIFGIIAWVMGNNDLRAMREGRMDPSGEGMTAAGRACAIIGTCINALGCCCTPGFILNPVFHARRFRF
jgi:hypothetical protein